MSQDKIEVVRPNRQIHTPKREPATGSADGASRMKPVIGNKRPGSDKKK